MNANLEILKISAGELPKFISYHEVLDIRIITVNAVHVTAVTGTKNEN